MNHLCHGRLHVTGEVYVQYSYDFEKQRAVKVWEFVLDQIVTCNSPKDIPTSRRTENFGKEVRATLIKPEVFLLLSRTVSQKSLRIFAQSLEFLKRLISRILSLVHVLKAFLYFD